MDMQQQYPPPTGPQYFVYRCPRCGTTIQDQAPADPYSIEAPHNCPQCGTAMLRQGPAQPGQAGPPPPMMMGPPRPYLPPPPYDSYGSRMKEYKNLGIVGLVMMLMGPIFFLPGWGPFGMVAAISMIFIGGLCALSGYMGYKDEQKKAGKPRIHNVWGTAATVAGIVAVLSSQAPGLPILLGCIAIALGKKAHDTGDLEGGEIGMICGGMGIVLGIILMVIFWL